jgi:hypothetical protein
MLSASSAGCLEKYLRRARIVRVHTGKLKKFKFFEMCGFKIFRKG